MNVLDLFSGIGGLSLGLQRAGMRTVAFCEIDEYCRAVLRKHWPEVPCFEDIHAIDSTRLDRLGRIDLICGGFPCQPFSLAGEQKGTEDDRNLWPEMRRVIALARPTWIIGENVVGLVALALDEVLADLENLGYTARTFIVPACAVGAPHRRSRLWIIATNADGTARRWLQQEREPDRRDTDAGRAGSQGAVSSMADADGGRREGEREQESAGLEGTSGCLADGRRPLRQLDDASADVANTGGARLPLSEQSNIRGEGRREEGGATSQCDWWAVEPPVGRVAYGIPKRVDRLRALGNAVVPQVVEEIGRAIMSVQGLTEKEYSL